MFLPFAQFYYQNELKKLFPLNFNCSILLMQFAYICKQEKFIERTFSMLTSFSISRISVFFSFGCCKSQLHFIFFYIVGVTGYSSYKILIYRLLFSLMSCFFQNIFLQVLFDIVQQVLLQIGKLISTLYFLFLLRNQSDLSLPVLSRKFAGWPLNLEFREIREKSGNLILVPKVRKLSWNLRKSWPKSGKKECHAFSSVNKCFKDKQYLKISVPS